MGLVELFVAALIAGISLVNATVPIAAWLRAHDGRFLMLAGANAFLALVGALWTWGELPGSPPSYTAVQLPILAFVLLVTVLLLASTLWPRHR